MSRLPETPLLDLVPTPDELRQLKPDQLRQLADELREEMIDAVSVSGGHLGSGLGVVELTVALHYVFNTPEDRLVWDVGHQCYPHKIITGRRDRIRTLRQGGGLSGFTKRAESEYDPFGAAHSSTSISAALGFAVANKLQGKPGRGIAVIGDGAMSAGMAYEAMNNAAQAGNRLVVILNDNDMSIAPPVGGLSAYLARMVSSSEYLGLRSLASRAVKKMSRRMHQGIRKAEEYTRGMVTGGTLFEELGFYYVGPIDGHNLDHLLPVLENVRDTSEGPVLIHVVTEKGKGYAPAEESADKYHGVPKFDVITGEKKKSAAGPPNYQNVFGDTLAKLADSDPRICAITAAMPSGTGVDRFAKAHPDRSFDVGIAEEHAALFACGHASQGLRPFLAIYSTFMQRAYDMIIHDMALQKLPVRLCMDRGGLSGDDGPTHHGLFDIGYLRHVPELVHMQPKDEDEFIDMLWTMANYDEGPIAIRYPRGNGPGATIKPEPAILEIGKAEVLQEGSDVCLIPLGTMMELALETKASLEEKGLSVTLINPRWIKPLDAECISRLASSAKVVCTYEDHVLSNGFGASIIELLHDKKIETQVERIGWPDEFVEHGRPDILRAKHGLTSAAATEKILSHFPA